jgi:hypothetical protein
LEKALDATGSSSSRDATSRASHLTLIVRKIQTDHDDVAISDAIASVLQTQFAVRRAVKVRHAKDDDIPYALIRFESEALAERILNDLQGRILLFGKYYKVDRT